jgi:hypothetical protein
MWSLKRGFSSHLTHFSFVIVQAVRQSLILSLVAVSSLTVYVRYVLSATRSEEGQTVDVV